MEEKSFTLSVLNSEEILFDGPVLSLYLPGAEGDMQLLPNHADIITLIRKGKVVIKTKEKGKIDFPVTSGFFQMKKNQATLLIS